MGVEESESVADSGGCFAFVACGLGLRIECLNEAAVSESSDLVFGLVDELEQGTV